MADAHDMHLDDPGLEYNPLPQDVQMEDPGCNDTVPAGQITQALVLPGDEYPAGHWKHWDEYRREKYPLGHAEQTVDPSEETDPAAQARHDVAACCPVWVL